MIIRGDTRSLDSSSGNQLITDREPEKFVTLKPKPYCLSPTCVSGYFLDESLFLPQSLPATACSTKSHALGF